MNFELLNTVFQYVTIFSIVFSLVGAIGTYWTGKIVEQTRQEKIRTLETTIDTIAPRQVTETQKVALRGALSLHRGQNVIVVSRLMDNESTDYARQIESVFRESGWNVGEMNRTLLGEFPGFITAAVSGDGNPKERLNMIQDAFVRAGINYQNVEIRPGTVSLQFQPNTVYIFVGRKG